MTPQGPKVEFETVRGGPIPSQWDAARIGAALGFTVAVTQVGPNRVQVTAVTRDTLAGPASTGPNSWTPAAEDLEGWGDDFTVIDGDTETGGNDGARA